MGDTSKPLKGLMILRVGASTGSAGGRVCDVVLLGMLGRSSGYSSVWR